MANRTDKPKKTSKELIDKLSNELGITFQYYPKDCAEHYLLEKNNYLRTASYRNNYDKQQTGLDAGKYIHLDFGYLVELSIIDMYFRNIVSKMCIDIEHDLKVKLLKDVEENIYTDGYDIVEWFLTMHPKIINKLAIVGTSPFTQDLVLKYFTTNTNVEPITGKIKISITGYRDCPVWVLFELLSFGDFLLFYEDYYAAWPPAQYDVGILNLIRCLRNATAHNNCLLFNLRRTTNTSPPSKLSIELSNIPTLKKQTRKKKLKCRTILEFVALLYVYSSAVSENVKKNRLCELCDLFDIRMKKKRALL